MRILGTLIFVLIAVPEILCSIDTDEPASTWNQYWLQSIRRLHGTIADEAIVTTYTNAAASAIDRTVCENNGGSKAYDAATGSIQEYFNCIRPLVQGIISVVDNTSSQLNDLAISGIMTNVACPMLPDAKNCFKHFYEVTRPCVTTDNVEDFATDMFNISIPIMEFMCNDGGKWITDFTVAEGNKCLASKEAAVRDCMNPSPKDPLEGNVINEPTPITTKPLDIPWLNHYIDECADLEKFQVCAVREMEGCNSPTPSNLLNSLLNVVKDVASCGNLAHSGTPDV